MTLKYGYMIMLVLVFIFSMHSCKDSSKKTNQKLDNEITKINKNSIKNLKYGCGFNKKVESDDILINKPGARELDQIKNITAFSGIPLNFEIYEANIQNAIATIIDNQRYILYDKKLLDLVNENTNSYWSSISILAHEIGHHLSGHTLSQLADNHKVELEADKFSGFVLYKMGATKDQAIKAINNIGSVEDSESHPSKFRRIEAISNGWDDAYELDYRSAIPPPLDDDPDSFYEYTISMLNNKSNADFYEGLDFEYDFMYGVITDSEFSNGQISNFMVEVIKTGKDWEENYGSLDGKRLRIFIDSGYGEEMCRACERQFKDLIQAGRRIKFAFEEGRPDGGSALTGVFYASYIKAINDKDIDFYLRNSNSAGINKIINDFLIAEENRNIDRILEYYSDYVGRYWDVKNINKMELANQYYNAWKYSKNAQNIVKNIIKINNNTYILNTQFRFYDIKKEKYKSLDSKVKFVFDGDNKIKKIYGIR